MTILYTATAYRWGYRNAESRYVVYVGPDKTKALALAQTERDDRGGKYGVSVEEWDEDGTESKQIAYFDSAWGEQTGPNHNWRYDFLTSIGLVFENAAKDGACMLPANDPRFPNSLSYQNVETPQWMKDEYARQLKRNELIRGVFEKAAKPKTEEQTK